MSLPVWTTKNSGIVRPRKKKRGFGNSSAISNDRPYCDKSAPRLLRPQISVGFTVLGRIRKLNWTLQSNYRLKSTQFLIFYASIPKSVASSSTHKKSKIKEKRLRCGGNK